MCYALYYMYVYIAKLHKNIFNWFKRMTTFICKGGKPTFYY